jgi:His/Glu/Gln/Arg/opine family amino acid ABC transporter permease subunit
MASDGFTAIQEGFFYLLKGAWVNVVVVIGAMLFGFLLGLPLALGQIYSGKATRIMISIYAWFFRGIPLLVFLFLFYFGLASFLNINLSAFSVAVIVLGLISSAYQSQILRGPPHIHSGLVQRVFRSSEGFRGNLCARRFGAHVPGQPCRFQNLPAPAYISAGWFHVHDSNLSGNPGPGSTAKATENPRIHTLKKAT